MSTFRALARVAGTVLCLTVGTAVAQTDAPEHKMDTRALQPHAGTLVLESADHAMNVRFQDLKWEKMQPELGDKASEITILRVDPETKATHLMIRVPKNFHVPKHWHTANETHTVVKGTFIMECEGKRETLAQGSWNYVPSKMAHEAWTKPDEGALLFITVDSAWDINWVGGPPKPTDFVGGREN